LAGDRSYEKKKWANRVARRPASVDELQRNVEALSAHRCRRQCEFRYQPEGGARLPLLALRYEKLPDSRDAEQPEQYQLFDTPE